MSKVAKKKPHQTGNLISFRNMIKSIVTSDTKDDGELMSALCNHRIMQPCPDNYYIKRIKKKKGNSTSIVLDGNTEEGAHVQSDFGYLICSLH